MSYGNTSIDDLLNAMLQKEEAHIEYVEVTQIDTNPYQPRRRFDEEALSELSRSIETYGVIQPIVVRPKGNRYELVAGERRLRATKLLGHDQIPALIRTLSDRESMEIALLENLQREQLSSIEEAEAYAFLMNELQLSQQALSERVGKSRSHIANHLRLLQLPEEVKKRIDRHELTMGHGRMLLRIEDEARCIQLAKHAVQQRWSVRELERQIDVLQKDRVAKKEQRDIFIEAEQRELSRTYECPVTITSAVKGKIELHYDSLQTLNDLLEKLKR